MIVDDTSIASDGPIDKPDQDLYRVDGFARTIAGCIRSISTPEGTVIALNGQWGSGKTSTINLVRHHLGEDIDAGDLEVIQFNGWWFRGEQAIAQAFFGELQAAIKPGLSGKARRLLPRLGAYVLQAGSLVGPAVTLGAGPGLGAVAGGSLNWLSKLIDQSESVEKIHRQISKALKNQIKKYLIIIDDIDRLSPDEVLTVFRLIKSVGRLPNIIYLIAYDKNIAEKIVADEFPSEGPHFLEKIIQASFDLPLPSHWDLKQQAFAAITTICGEPSGDQYVAIGNAFHAVIAPELDTPRDVLRYANALSVTWPALASEVNHADFIAIEALRLFQSDVYSAVRRNKNAIFSPRDDFSRDERSAYYEALFLGAVGDENRIRLKQSLMRLFPQLQLIWANVHHQTSGPVWTRERRICSSQHFDTYFRFGLDPEAISKQEIDVIIKRASDQDFVQGVLIDGLNKQTREGGTRAAVLLDELSLYGPMIASCDVQSFLSAVFEIADDLVVDADQIGSVGAFGTELRLYWLTRECLGGRFSLSERSDLVAGACLGAPVGWLSYLAESLYLHHFPRDDREPKAEEDWLADEATVIALRDDALAAIRQAALGGTLIHHNDLAALLYRWRRFGDDDGLESKQWANAQLDKDRAVVRFARAFTGESRSWGMGFDGLGDMVARRHVTAQIESIAKIMDRHRFRARLEEVVRAEAVSPEELSVVRAFLAAWDRH